MATADDGLVKNSARRADRMMMVVLLLPVKVSRHSNNSLLTHYFHFLQRGFVKKKKKKKKMMRNAAAAMSADFTGKKMPLIYCLMHHFRLPTEHLRLLSSRRFVGTSVWHKKSVPDLY